MILAALAALASASLIPRHDAGSLLDKAETHPLQPPTSWLQTGSKDDPDDSLATFDLSPEDMKKQYDKQSTDEMVHSLEQDDQRVLAETAKMKDVSERTTKEIQDDEEKVQAKEHATEEGFKDHLEHSLEQFEDKAKSTEEKFKDSTEKMEAGFKKIMDPSEEDIEDSSDEEPSSFLEEGAPDSFADLDAKLKALEEKTKAELAKLQSDTPSSFLEEAPDINKIDPKLAGIARDLDAFNKKLKQEADSSAVQATAAADHQAPLMSSLHDAEHPQSFIEKRQVAAVSPAGSVNLRKAY